MKALTPKQENFVLFYLESLNATDAYERAYDTTSRRSAEVGGSKLLSNPKIQVALNNQMAELKNEHIADAEEVLLFLSETMRSKKNYTKDRLHAAELLGKRHALFTDKVKTEGSLEINIMVDTEEE